MVKHFPGNASPFKPFDCGAMACDYNYFRRGGHWLSFINLFKKYNVLFKTTPIRDIIPVAMGIILTNTFFISNEAEKQNAAIIIYTIIQIISTSILFS
jgi:hypothetical protein